MEEEEGLVRRQQSDDLMLLQEGGTDNEYINEFIDEDEFMAEQELLTPLMERESDTDDVSLNGDTKAPNTAAAAKKRPGNLARNSKLLS